jgi:hypothetical protein
VIKEKDGIKEQSIPKSEQPGLHFFFVSAVRPALIRLYPLYNRYAIRALDADGGSLKIKLRKLHNFLS